MKTALRLLLVLGASVGLFFLAALLRGSGPAPTPPAAAPAASHASMPSATPVSAAIPARAPLPETSSRLEAEDPRIRRWRTAVRQHARKEVLELQSEFLAKGAEYQERLLRLAREDSDPRIRAFTIAVLGRMSSPPPEQFFLDRSDDPHEYPRTSALEALAKLGSSACLATVDRLAAGDPAAGVRAAAAGAAKAVRSR